jgi:ribonuclease PH
MNNDAATVQRPSKRAPRDMRAVSLERGVAKHAEGSCLVRFGGTLVHCTASVETGVPPFKKGSGQGWVTAEYAMLPRATQERTSRERHGPGGRSQEIQRLIGRSLRAAVGRWDFGEYTIKIDCDVLQADGGTRTASITGACVALADAFGYIAIRTGQPSAFGQLVAAVSVGLVENEVTLDLAYVEDRDAQVDANIIMRAPKDLVEVQGTGEQGTFNRAQFDQMLDLAEAGITQLFEAQRKALGW